MWAVSSQPDEVASAKVCPVRVRAAPAWAEVVLDYCSVTRGILNDDQGTTLDPPGLRMARALEEVKVSLDVCRDAKNGGPQRTC